ncbi:Ras guanine nucleotide exchange factor F [Daldinia childiae]|uniref:Ras guanine nucleotide exchange factor F n=1 Tax=Daldinia childiae TaxID=326645 RepID=UPI001444DF13|nr:Ras guanine nucleotide exchange factor F [Daldinia childiae]KAF3063987.1 Ras guanine nucleotide exchange factor F [Daldinia childiae]
MAEIVAGIWAAEQAVSTSIYAGATGYAVAKPTMPLKATFSQIASTSDDASRSSLTRSHHTLTVVGDKAYIFGGQTSQGKLASNTIHSIALPKASSAVPEYQALPAISTENDGPVPKPRTKHSACALNNRVAIYGGCDESGNVLDEGPIIWLFDVEKLTWSTLKPSSHPERTPLPRSKAHLVAHDGNLILIGGVNSNGEALTDVWHYNCFTEIWNQLPHTPAVVTSATISGHTLYSISSSDALGSEVHYLKIQSYTEPASTWQTISFPTNPLTPGPRPRSHGGLIPITTGYGRNYLLYFFGDCQGEVEKGDLLQWSDLWTFQLPSSDLEVKATATMKEAIKPAKIKDQIRSKLGADTGASSWAEVEVQPPGDLKAHEGKVHPGPRSSFGYDMTADGRNVVLWGGCNATGGSEGDGWIIEFS